MRTALLLPLVLAFAYPVSAQTPGSDRPASTVELNVGYAGFVDEATMDHTIVGAPHDSF
jgi:hypothetical protein